MARQEQLLQLVLLSDASLAYRPISGAATTLIIMVGRLVRATGTCAARLERGSSAYLIVVVIVAALLLLLLAQEGAIIGKPPPNRPQILRLVLLFGGGAGGCC